MAPKRKAVSQPEEREEKKVALEVEPELGLEERKEQEEQDGAAAAPAGLEEDAEPYGEATGDEEEEQGSEDEEEGDDTPSAKAAEEDEADEAVSPAAAEPPTTAPTSVSTVKPISATSAPTDPASNPAPAPVQTDWQAVWAPAYNAYYFFNARTGETTWVNPLDPSASASAHAQAGGSAGLATAGPSAVAPGAGEITALPPAAAAAAVNAQTNPWALPPSNTAAEGIDPLLYHLDPTLSLSSSGPSSSSGLAYTAQARFNAHTGRFEADPLRTPERMSEFERAKRMSEVYFDTERWEKEVEERKRREAEEEGRRKRPTKKDLERFAEAKKRKKLAKTAWLRN